jgi:hypothetical protein
MLKKTIHYHDFDGNERVGDFYFNFTEAELAEMELSVNGGFAKMLQSIIDAQDIPSIAKVFKDIIIKSYGVKSADGIRFEKSDELARQFTQTDAYNVLYMELVQDAKKMADFCNSLIPKSLAEKAAKLQAEKNATN